MKKLFFILLACFISVAIVPLGNAQTPDGVTPADETICDGLENAAFGLCVAYCEAEDCDLLPGGSLESCEDLRKNYAKHTGKRAFPCDDVLACCICADVVGQGTEGVCTDILNSPDPEAECAALSSDALGVLDYECSEVSCPAESEDPGCSLVFNFFGVQPPCLNGISDICLPFGAPAPPCETGRPLCAFLGGVLLDEPCPSVPSCF